MLKALSHFFDALVGAAPRPAAPPVDDRLLTAAAVLVHEWTRPYTREQAVYPMEYVRANKFWPSVARIDSAYGDRNLICSCTPLEEYVDQQEELVQADKGPSY